VQYATFPNIGMKSLLPKLSNIMSSYRSAAIKIPVPSYKVAVPNEDNETITHSWFWPRVGKFFRPKDIVIAETGKSGHLDLREMLCEIVE
jgi:pyruvate decarboxylase